MVNQTAGLICAHHHLYSTLARGMPATAKTPINFLEILQQVWWRLDAALDDEMIYWSAMLGATEALINGTTCIILQSLAPARQLACVSMLVMASQTGGMTTATCTQKFHLFQK